MSFREMLQKIKQKTKIFEDMVTTSAHSWENVRTKQMKERWIKEKDVLALLDLQEKQLQALKVSLLEMFCYQGPPTRHWLETKGQFWEGWNACLKKILGVDSEKKE